jgi:NADPH-dependent FMN reductase
VWGIKRNCPNGFAVSGLKIAIILGSTRPGRNGKAVADWVFDKAQARMGADYDLFDLLRHPLPHIYEAIPPSVGQYAGEHTRPGLPPSPPTTRTSSSRPCTTTPRPGRSKTASTTSTRLATIDRAAQPSDSHLSLSATMCR